jgi:hypothetical protein
MVPMHAAGRVVDTLLTLERRASVLARREEFVLAVAAMLALRLTRPSGR